MNFDKYGGRRYLLCWGALIAASILQYAGKLDLAGTAYAAIIMGTVGAYIAGNVLQKKNENKEPA